MKSNDDCEGEGNSKKVEENNNSARESHFLVHFFEITPRLRRPGLNFLQ